MGNINVICQNCGIGLEIEDDVTSFDCPNCGARLHTDFQALEDTEIYYQDHVVRNRGVQSQRKGRGGLAAIILAAIIFTGAGFYIGSVKPGNVQGVLSEVAGSPTIVTWPLTYKQAKDKSFRELSDILKKRGFTNINEITKDLPNINIARKKAGQIIEIQILTKGKTLKNNDIERNQEFPSDVEITITYYK